MRLPFNIKPDPQQLSAKRVVTDSLLLSGLMTGLILLVVRVNPAMLSRGEVDAKTKNNGPISLFPHSHFYLAYQYSPTYC
jgi:hypothetical protein